MLTLINALLDQWQYATNRWTEKQTGYMRGKKEEALRKISGNASLQREKENVGADAKKDSGRQIVTAGN